MSETKEIVETLARGLEQRSRSERRMEAAQWARVFEPYRADPVRTLDLAIIDHATSEAPVKVPFDTLRSVAARILTLEEIVKQNALVNPDV